MPELDRSKIFAVLSASLLMFGLAFKSHAQSSNNVLGLPAVPQVPQAPQAVGSNASAAKPGASPVSPSEAETKSAISGSIKLASFYQESGVVVVRVATDRTYVGAAPRAQALQAARLVQRDIRLSCGKLCKPGPMPAPAIQADNTLTFDLVITGYSGLLSTADMVNLVSAKAIGPGGKAAPVAVPVATVAAGSATTAPASVAPASAGSTSAPLPP